MACSTKELITSRAVELNITVKRNDTFNPYVTLLENGVAFNFTGYDSANMQVKLPTDSTTVYLLLTVANGRLTLGGVAGTITFFVDKDDMDIEPNTYIYDLEVHNSATDVRETVLEGKFIVEDDVTRITV